MFHRALVLLWSLCCWGAVAVSGYRAEPYSLRLFGGDSRCRGQLQIQRTAYWRKKEWTEVHSPYAPLSFGHRVCLELDCGPAVSAEEKTVSERLAASLAPDACEDTSLFHCFTFEERRSGTSLELNCSDCDGSTDSVRLVSGQGLCSGSVQIWDQSLNQSWTSVCEGALDRRGAEVLCRELGCGAPLLQGALSPLGQTFHCEGHESALMDCPRNQARTDPGTCPGPALNLTCSDPVRLVGGASRCEGSLEVRYSGEWRRLESSEVPELWGLEAAAAVCRSLDCGSVVSTERRRRPKWTEVWRVRADCIKEKAAVRDCVESVHSYSNHGLEVVCSDSVRLVSGRSLCSGSVQIRDLDRSWTSVCEGALDRRGAEVLCRELGCGAPLLQGALSPLGQTFHCEGHESALMDCPRNQTRTDPGTCSTLQLTCSEPLRLVGGPGRCEGTLELKHRGEWRPVRVPDNTISLQAAAAVCQGLDCGLGRSIEELSEFVSPVWLVTPKCMTTKKASVRDCVSRGFSGRDLGVRVKCEEW